MPELTKKIYIYPYSSRVENLGLYNPYIDDLVDSLGEFYVFINKNKPSKTGIFDIFRYLLRTDFVYFNWIEKLPSNKGGKLQTVVLLLLVRLMKMAGVKIIWTMHNKISHDGNNLNLTKMIFKLMLKHADHIITHSSEGIDFGEEMHVRSKRKIRYFAHPVKDKRTTLKGEKVYDILIWGTLSPYKGIDKFLDFLKKRGMALKYNILIAGKSTSEEYLARLKEHENERISVSNRFIGEDELQGLVGQSKIVLFTYSKSSILSSGVLMDSIGYGAKVVGPKVGAFGDLEEDGIVDTFTDFDELAGILDGLLAKGVKNEGAGIDNFLKENSWKRFAEKIHALLNG